jgi:hypothetical protein
MEGADAQMKEVHVAVAVGHGGEPADLVVDALHDPGADGLVEVAPDLPCEREHRIGELLEGLDGAGVGFEYPLLQILLRRCLLPRRQYSRPCGSAGSGWTRL